LKRPGVMERRIYTDARAIARRMIQAGKASKVLKPFRVRKGDTIVVADRVSNCERRANLKDQEKNLRWRVERDGGKVVGVVNHVGSGVDPSWIRKAARL
jgi:predicted site-specific integrase-resolvase